MKIKKMKSVNVMDGSIQLHTVVVNGKKMMKNQIKKLKLKWEMKRQDRKTILMKKTF